MPCILCGYFIQCEHFPPPDDCPNREREREEAGEEQGEKREEGN
jgi:hypothetical protein